MSKKLASLITIIIFIQVPVYATESAPFICDLLYEDALQLHSDNPDDEISFGCKAEIIDNPDLDLGGLTVSNPNGKGCDLTCGTDHCSATGSAVSKIDIGEFQPTSATSGEIVINENTTLGTNGINNFYDVTINSGTLSFAEQGTHTTYYFNKLSAKQGTKVDFIPGEYWINDWTGFQGTSINVVGEGTVHLYINSFAEFKQGLKVNYDSENMQPHKLFIYAYDDLILKQGDGFAGFIYAKGNVTLNQNVTMHGGILAQSIDLRNSATITYIAEESENIDYHNICTGPDATYFDLDYEPLGSLCIPHEVTITARTANRDIATNYTGTVTLNTGVSSGTWALVSGNGSFSDATANDGLATYTFSTDDNGVAVVSLLFKSDPGVSEIMVSDNSAGSVRDDGEGGELSFNPQGFIITSQAVTTDSPESYSNAIISGVSETMYITVRGADAATACSIDTAYSGSKLLHFWQEYKNPESGTKIAYVNGVEIGSSEQSATSQIINFTNGSATVNFLYRDVGKIKFKVADQSIPIRGETDNFVVKPAQFAISVPNNPQAADANGTVFTKAGENFTVNVTVQDINGNTTTNYGNEVSPESIRLMSGSLIGPSNGVLGNITMNSVTQTSPGVYSADISYDEVGIITLIAGVGDLDYLGTGDITGPESNNVGRFIPYHFSVASNVPVIHSGCAAGGFSYLGQELLYDTQPLLTITALNKSNVETTNYKGDYWKMAAENVTISYNSAVNLDSSAAQNDITILPQGNGLGIIQLGDGGGFAFSKIAGTNIAPFVAELQIDATISDADGVQYSANPYILGGTGSGEGISFSSGKNMYQGRIEARNAFGSELMPLSIPIELQYYNGTLYVTNTIDSCTAINNVDYVQLSPYPANLSTTLSVTTFINGIGKIELSSPTPVGITGYVDVELDLSIIGENIPYLQHDWPHDNNADGVFNDNPVSRGTFGIYEGDKNVIYRKEVR